MKEGWISMTTSEFMQRFRPDGVGYISASDEQGNIIYADTIDEIVCDFCNTTIELKNEKKEDNTVFMLYPGLDYTICPKCHEHTQKTKE